MEIGGVCLRLKYYFFYLFQRSENNSIVLFFATNERDVSTMIVFIYGSCFFGRAGLIILILVPTVSERRATRETVVFAVSVRCERNAETD